MSNGVEQSVVPIPPRYWWLRRITIASAVLVVVLVITRIWWGIEAERRIVAAIERCREAGGPVTIEEIDGQFAAIPDENNAAILYEEAMKKVAANGAELSELLYGDRSFTEDAEAAHELHQRNAAALGLVKQARERSEVAWSYTLADTVAQTGVFPWTAKRKLAKLLAFTASFEFTRRDDAQALETLRDALRYGDALQVHPTLLGSLVSFACTQLTVDRIEEHAHLLAEVREPESGLVRETTRTLIRTLLDVDRVRESFAMALVSERGLAVDHWESDSLGGFYFMSMGMPILLDEIITFLVSPAFVAKAARAIDFESATVELAALSRFPRNHELWAGSDRGYSSIELMSGAIARNRARIARRAFFMMNHIIAERRMAAIALAIRLHEMDHGAFPATLQELVPQYLTDLPEDPFAEPGSTFVHASDREHPVLYSVGENGIDDGGDPPFEGLDCGTWRCDLVFYLNGVPSRDAPAESGSTKTVEKDGTPGDNNGKDTEDQTPKQ